MHPLRFQSPAENQPETSPSDLPSDPSPSETATTAEQLSQWQTDALTDQDSSSPSPGLDPGTADRISSAASSGKGPGKRQTQELARGVVKTAGAMAQRALERDEHDAGVYLTDDDDARAIGNPLGSIAHRRGWLGGESGNPDLVDAIQCAVGLFFYGSKVVARWMTARAERQAAAAAAAADAEPYDVAAGA